jgi:hypothetical protein
MKFEKSVGVMLALSISASVVGCAKKSDDNNNTTNAVNGGSGGLSGSGGAAASGMNPGSGGMGAMPAGMGTGIAGMTGNGSGGMGASTMNGGTGGMGSSTMNAGSGGMGSMMVDGGSGGMGEVAPPVGDEPDVVDGCDGQKLYKVPDDTGALGPWPVGVKTIKVPVGSTQLTAEIWYPAKFGSNAGMEKVTYDLRDWLPPEDQGKVPDSDNKSPVCECYRDLPIDTDHGPYPGIVYVHGLGSFRIASLTTMELWASRGFIVVAADHPGDFLTDYLASFGGCTGSGLVDPGDMSTEAAGEFAALTGETGDFAFLGTALDKTRLGMGGHSLGGQATADSAGNTQNVQIAITLAPLGGGTLTGSQNLKSALQITGTADGVTGYSTTWYPVAQTPIKRMIGILGAGHIDVSDLCKDKNDAGLRSIDVANKDGVCGAAAISGLAQCGDDPASEEQAPLIVGYATTAALEETLHCQDRTAAFDMLQSKFSTVSTFSHTP